MLKNLNLFKEIYSQQVNPNIPNFRPGDRIEIEQFYFRPEDSKNKTEKSDVHRVKSFKGIVIARSGKLIDANVTILLDKEKDESVEITFPIHSPLIKSIKIIEEGRHRRAKLYYLSNLEGKKRKFKIKRKR
jgi:large subunit ribosomal protein L19